MSPAETPSTDPAPGELRLLPFRALRYDPSRVGDLAAVTSPPYDQLGPAGVAEYEARSPHNVVRLVLPAGDPPARYARAARLLAQWRRAGVLVVDPQPALYVYEQHGPGHVQRGLVGALALPDPAAQVVLPHEDVMAGPVADRAALMEATAAQLEPILCLYDGPSVVDETLADVPARTPAVDVTTAERVRHRVWPVTEPARLAALAEALRSRQALIADGHHRFAAYRRLAGAAGRRDARAFGLACLVEAGAPRLAAQHRVVPGVTARRAAELAGSGWRVRSLQPAAPERLLASLAGVPAPAYVVADRADAYLLDRPGAAVTATLTTRSAAWRSLDVCVAQALLAAWGVSDEDAGGGNDSAAAAASPAVSRLLPTVGASATPDPSRLRPAGYAADAGEALGRAARASGSALLLRDPAVADVFAVARAGERMPRKSTSFTPKPANGLLMRLLGD